MRLMKKTFLAFLLLTFCLTASKASADDSLAHTIKSALYGGALGGIVAGAVVLLSSDTSGNLGYIPTGIGAGVLIGTAYGIATSEAVQDRAFGEIKNGKFTMNVPTVKSTSTFDEKLQTYETVESMDLLKVRF